MRNRQQAFDQNLKQYNINRNKFSTHSEHTVTSDSHISMDAPSYQSDIQHVRLQSQEQLYQLAAQSGHT